MNIDFKTQNQVLSKEIEPFSQIVVENMVMGTGIIEPHPERFFGKIRTERLGNMYRGLMPSWHI